MEEINLGGCIYMYENKGDTYTLYYANNNMWRYDLKGKKAFEIHDFGNGIGINPKLVSRKTLDYGEASELFFLLSKYHENENKNKNI